MHKVKLKGVVYLEVENSKKIEERSEGNSKRSEENIIEKTCRELGVNQKQLAEKTGFANQTISKWKKTLKLPENAIKHFNLLVEFHKLQNAFIRQNIK